MKILQISHNDWSKTYSLSDGIQWYCYDPQAKTNFDLRAVDSFDATIINCPCELEDLLIFEPLINPYTLVIDQTLQPDFDKSYDTFFKQKMARFEELSSPQMWMDELPKKYFTEQFGRKLPIQKIVFSPLHKDRVWYEGTKYFATHISYEGEYRQLLFWKLNIEYDNQYDMELWLEYKISKGCSIEFDVQFVQEGSGDVILFHKRYQEDELAEPIPFSHEKSGYIVCSVFVKGEGLVEIGPIHYRHARRGVGHFFPGGRRLVDQNRQELFVYFHPGNLKPPFNIYFAGYRLEEGFEGYPMMKGFDHPFLLITDPRLEGGNFYVGTQELEDQLLQVIYEYIVMLGLAEGDVIMSGLSMGSFGALYYGAKIKPHAIILGKPILDVGYTAELTRLVRPYDFLTALDMAKYWDKSDGQGQLIPLPEFHQDLKKHWTEENCFEDTMLLIARMEQDDYDDQAYYTLLETQSGKPTTIIARGYPGRHNDDSKTIVDWFEYQYHRVIDEYAKSREKI